MSLITALNASVKCHSGMTLKFGNSQSLWVKGDLVMCEFCLFLNKLYEKSKQADAVEEERIHMTIWRSGGR